MVLNHLIKNCSIYRLYFTQFKFIYYLIVNAVKRDIGSIQMTGFL